MTSGGVTLKVLDLGLVRLPSLVENGDGASNVTQVGRLYGHAELHRGRAGAADPRRADIRSDLYSLGCTFYFAVTGDVPFPGGTSIEKLFRHLSEEAVPVERLCPEVPPAVAQIIRRLMAKNPEERFQTPAELVKAIAVFLTSVSRLRTESPKGDTLHDMATGGPAEAAFTFELYAAAHEAAHFGALPCGCGELAGAVSLAVSAPCWFTEGSPPTDPWKRP